VRVIPEGIESSIGARRRLASGDQPAPGLAKIEDVPPQVASRHSPSLPGSNLTSGSA